MAPTSDPRRIVGNIVHAKAIHVTNIAECARRYGSKKKSKKLRGVVQNVIFSRGSGRRNTNIVATYQLGGNVEKTVTLNSRAVIAGPPPEDAEAIAPPLIGVAAPEVEISPIAMAGNASGTQIRLGCQPPNIANAPPMSLLPPPTNAATPPPVPPATEGVDATMLTPAIDETPPVQAPPEEATGFDTTAPPTVPAAPPTINLGDEVVVHGQRWSRRSHADLCVPINGLVVPKAWSICHPTTGDQFSFSSDIRKAYSSLDYFLLMFPPKQLQETVRLTNIQLEDKSGLNTTPGEILKWIGVLILLTRYEFGSRRKLWSTTSSSKYIPAPAFGKTGMSRNRFDTLWANVRWSDQPAVRPDGMLSERYRWMLVDGFVDRINDYRQNFYVPSQDICVDESMSRWYGQGGHWINHGLPMYVAIDRKPENGSEIQNSADGQSGIMLRLKIVTTAAEAAANNQHEENENGEVLLHGIQVLKDLVMPWANTDRIVCADSYFASVGAALELKRIGLRFIGVVKTATRRYPMKALSEIELVDRGDFRGLVSVGDGSNSLLAFVWMDRDRRYFISTTSSLANGVPYSRERWRQVDVTTPNAPPERVELTIPQPKAAEIYYSTCASIDQHNRARQDDLMLERKLGTHDWSKRLNSSLLAMCIVDAWLAFHGCRGGASCPTTQREFYEDLAEQLIDNSYNGLGRRNRDSATPSPARVPTNDHSSGVDAHLTPTKRKKRTRDGIETKYTMQGRCMECNKPGTTQVCSECTENPSNTKIDNFLCSTRKGKQCFRAHIQKYHN